MSDALDPFSYYVPGLRRWPPTRRSRPRARPARASSFARRGGYPVRRRPAAGLPGREGRRQGRATSSTRSTASRCATRRSGRSRPRSRGPEGSSCELVALPRRRREARDAARRRARFDAPAPSARSGSATSAIVKIPTFTPATAAAIRKELDEATRRSITTRGPRPARLDRRRRSPDAAPVAALFVGEGPDRDGRLAQGRRSKPLEATGDPVWKGQVVVLIDDSTAGAGRGLRGGPARPGQGDDRRRDHGRHGDHPEERADARKAAPST